MLIFCSYLNKSSGYAQDSLRVRVPLAVFVHNNIFDFLYKLIEIKNLMLYFSFGLLLILHKRELSLEVNITNYRIIAIMCDR